MFPATRADASIGRHRSVRFERVGFDRVMVESEFPHPNCLYSSTVKHDLEVIEIWGVAVQGVVMGFNAAKLYEVFLPAAWKDRWGCRN